MLHKLCSWFTIEVNTKARSYDTNELMAVMKALLAVYRSWYTQLTGQVASGCVLPWCRHCTDEQTQSPASTERNFRQDIPTLHTARKPPRSDRPSWYEAQFCPQRAQSEPQ